MDKPHVVSEFGSGSIAPALLPLVCWFAVDSRKVRVHRIRSAEAKSRSSGQFFSIGERFRVKTCWHDEGFRDNVARTAFLFYIGRRA